MLKEARDLARRHAPGRKLRDLVLGEPADFAGFGVAGAGQGGIEMAFGVGQFAAEEGFVGVKGKGRMIVLVAVVERQQLDRPRE